MDLELIILSESDGRKLAASADRRGSFELCQGPGAAAGRIHPNDSRACFTSSPSRPIRQRFPQTISEPQPLVDEKDRSASTHHRAALGCRRSAPHPPSPAMSRCTQIFVIACRGIRHKPPRAARDPLPMWDQGAGVSARGRQGKFLADCLLACLSRWYICIVPI